MIDLLSIEEANKIYEFNENPALAETYVILFPAMRTKFLLIPGVALTPEEERSFIGKA